MHRFRPHPTTSFVLALAPLLVATWSVTLVAPIERAPVGIPVAFVVAGVAWLVAVRQAGRGAAPLAIVMAGALALRLVAFARDPALSDDVFRNVWEGSVTLEGVSPYAFAPESARLAALRVEHPGLFAALNNPDVSAAYPPVTQAAGAAVVGLARFAGYQGLAAAAWVRAFFGLCDLLVLWPLVVLLRRARLPDGLAVVWGWSPLVALEFAGSGHFDSLGVLLTLGGLALLPGAVEGDAVRRGAARRVAALATLAGAILVKLLPLAALPFVARGARRGLPGAAGDGPGLQVVRVAFVALACGACFVPLLALEGGLSGLGAGLGEYGLRWESTSLVYRWIEPVAAAAVRWTESAVGAAADPRVVGRAFVGLLWVLWVARAFRRGLSPVAGTGTAIAAFLVLSPTLHPWYVTWVLPFVALRARGWSRTAWLLFAAAVPLFYLTLVPWRTRGAWEEPAWLWPAVALPFLLMLAAGSRIVRRSSPTRNPVRS